MNYYLAGEEKKQSQLVKLLNKFAKDKSIETLARGIMKILETPIQRRLIPTIRLAQKVVSFNQMLLCVSIGAVFSLFFMLYFQSLDNLSQEIKGKSSQIFCKKIKIEQA
jgi:hypothetical protein